MFKFGSHPLVVLNDYEAIKSAYVNQPDVFAGRPDMFVQLDVFGDTGTVVSRFSFFRLPVGILYRCHIRPKTLTCKRETRT